MDTLTPEPFDLRPSFLAKTNDYIIMFEAKKTITSLRCFCVSVNLRAFAANFAEVVDQLLICEGDLV